MRVYPHRRNDLVALQLSKTTEHRPIPKIFSRDGMSRKLPMSSATWPCLRKIWHFHHHIIGRESFGYAEEGKIRSCSEMWNRYFRFSQFPRLDDITGFLTRWYARYCQVMLWVGLCCENFISSIRFQEIFLNPYHSSDSFIQNYSLLPYFASLPRIDTPHILVHFLHHTPEMPLHPVRGIKK